MSQHTILWADDEIDLLKPHVMFLKNKGYDVVTVNNGADALALVQERHFDLIILDENMPGLTGLETLSRIKIHAPGIPVIMITKSEEENIMDQAVGSKIADYLIKPSTYSRYCCQSRRTSTHLNLYPHSRPPVTGRTSAKSHPLSTTPTP